MAILGLSKVSKGNRITLTSDVVKDLKIKVGDKVVFEKDEKTGMICIKKG